MDEIHDTSRLDAFLASRRRATVLHALWRPMLAGAAASLAVSAAIWAVLPRFEVRNVEVPRISYRDAEVPHIVTRDVTLNNPVPHDVPIDIPRIVTAPRSAEEFEASPAFRDAGVHGRFAGPDRNGFRLDSGQTFYPARLVNGQPELATDAKDDVSRLAIGDPIYCAPTVPAGLYNCHAFHRGRIEEIAVLPTGRPL
jgi:hypothetical protein